jgi:F-type H+-transporting ATPase subunit a
MRSGEIGIQPSVQNTISIRALFRILPGFFILAVFGSAFLTAVPARASDVGQSSDDSSVNKFEETLREVELGHSKEPDAMGHVMDDESWHFFYSFGSHVHLPKIFGFQITKFMILELLAAGLILLIYIPLARRVNSGEPLKGWKDNMFECLLTFVRNEIAKPGIGEHDADKYVPFLWTMFLFILFNNLLGIFPFAGSPTANIYMTGGLALCVFFAIHGSAIAKMGFVHYLESMWPHFDVPYGLGFPLKLFIFFIEIFGVLVKNAVLAVRLFANMFAGHMVLATILIFIYAAKTVGDFMWGTITLSSVSGIVLLSLLEIFVAFLQTYIFVFLTALFMGMALHPQH